MQNILATLITVIATLLLIVGAVALVVQLASSSKTQLALDHIQALRQATLSVLAGRNGWGYEDLTAALIETNLAPPDMVSGTSMHDQWGGAVDVSTNPTCEGIRQCIDIQMDSVPRSACIHLASALRSNCSVNLGIDGAWACGATVTPAWAESACSSQTDNTLSIQYLS